MTNEEILYYFMKYFAEKECDSDGQPCGACYERCGNCLKMLVRKYGVVNNIIVDD